MEINKDSTEVIKFTKEQILKSTKYNDKQDLINALLKNKCQYTLREVDDLIEKFMNSGVRK